MLRQIYIIWHWLHIKLHLSKKKLEIVTKVGRRGNFLLWEKLRALSPCAANSGRCDIPIHLMIKRLPSVRPSRNMAPMDSSSHFITAPSIKIDLGLLKNFHSNFFFFYSQNGSFGCLILILILKYMTRVSSRRTKTNRGIQISRFHTVLIPEPDNKFIFERL